MWALFLDSHLDCSSSPGLVVGLDYLGNWFSQFVLKNTHNFSFWDEFLLILPLIIVGMCHGIADPMVIPSQELET